MYQIKATEGIQVLLPAKYVGEIKALPEDVLSATEAMADVSDPWLLKPSLITWTKH